jgi:hypothetical protein
MKVYLDLAKVCASTCDYENGINSTWKIQALAINLEGIYTNKVACNTSNQKLCTTRQIGFFNTFFDTFQGDKN